LHLFAFQSQWIHRFGATLLVCAFALAPLFVVHRFRSHLGDSLIQFGEKIKGKAARESQPPNLISSTGPIRTNTSTATHPPMAPSENPVHPASGTLAPLHAIPAAPTNSVDNAAGSLDSRRRFQHSIKDRSPLAQHLWSAVGNGDNAAAILLADLYLTGEGVPKSCEQARVLLQVASKRGNADALRRLQTVNKTNCR
jgi:hypothetical protein